MYQVYLIAYSHSTGTGRTFNYRTDGNPPSFSDIESIEKKMCDRYGLKAVCVSGIYRMADSEEYYGDAS